MLPLGGCLLATDKLDPGLDVPQAYEYGPKKPAVAEVAVPPLDWWRSFRSKELTEVIEEARAANLDIAVAVARSSRPTPRRALPARRFCPESH